MNTINRRSFTRSLLGLPALFAFGRAEPQPRYPHYSYAVKKQGDWDLHQLHLPGMEIELDYIRIVFDKAKGESWLDLRIRPAGKHPEPTTPLGGRPQMDQDFNTFHDGGGHTCFDDFLDAGSPCGSHIFRESDA